VVGLLVLVVVLAVSTAGGLLWQRRTGRLRPTSPTGVPAAAAVPPTVPALLAGLGVDPAAAPVTLVQFSSAFCQPCRATRRVLGEVVRLLPVVGYVEVDAESHLDAVRALGILRTPTVLVLDPAGRVVQRASGQPRLADVIAAVAPHLPDRSADHPADHPTGRPAGRATDQPVDRAADRVVRDAP
jgi:thiol-disulfide isomerase/thioredoxin